MTTMLLAEDLFLLTHDGGRGRSASTAALDEGLAGALLLDLAAAELLTTSKKGAVIAVDGAATHPLLAQAHQLISTSSRTRSPEQWVSRLPRDLSPLARSVGRSLVERGARREVPSKTWGLIPTTSWPAADPAPDDELRATLEAVLIAGRDPDPRTSRLVSLLSALDLVTQVVAKDNRAVAAARATALRESAASSRSVTDAVSTSLQAIQVAVLVAVVVPTVISATSG